MREGEMTPDTELHWRLQEQIEDLVHRAIEDVGAECVSIDELTDTEDPRRYQVEATYDGMLSLGPHVCEYVYNDDDHEGFLMIHTSMQGEVYLNAVGGDRVSLKVYPRA